MQIRRSRTRGWQEKIQKSLGYKAFRCREQNCGWRGVIKAEPLYPIIQSFLKKHRNQAFLVTSLIFILPLILLLITACERIF
jgi:hypothetical protein